MAEELLRHQVDASALEAARSRALSCDPAYVMFTSGSTGTPKGVAVMAWAVAALCIASAYHVLSPGRLQSVRQVLFSGEVIPRKHLDAWLRCLPDTRFVNLYGPTEITCNCLYHVVDRTAAYPQGLPLGRSFSHCEVLLLDEANRLVTEPGKLGELVVRGLSVALGYVGNPEATERSFVQNPQNGPCHDRVYFPGVQRCRRAFDARRQHLRVFSGTFAMRT